MFDRQLLTSIENNNCLKGLFSKINKGENATLAIASSARVFFVSLAWQICKRPLFILIPGENAAHSFFLQLSLMIGRENVSEFLCSDVSFIEEKPILKKVASSRNKCIHDLISGKNKVIVSCTSSYLNRVTSNVEFYSPIKLSVGDEIESLDNFFVNLEELGYEKVKSVNQPGQFSFKGGTLDLYPGSLNFAVRVDFFGDEIESIQRIFAPSGQAITKIDSVEIYPCNLMPLDHKSVKRAEGLLVVKARTDKNARNLYETLSSEINLNEKHLLAPYLSRMCDLREIINPNYVFCLMEPQALMMDATRILEKVKNEFAGSGASVEDFFTNLHNMQSSKNQLLSFESVISNVDEVDARVKILRTNITNDDSSINEKIRTWLDSDFHVLFASSDNNISKKLEEHFVDSGFSINNSQRAEVLKKRVINLVGFDLPVGFVVPELKLVVISANDFNNYFYSRNLDDFDRTKITFPYNPGDFVVHSTFGVAKFNSILKKEIDGCERDYIELFYAGKDKLFLPIEQFDKLTKYVGPQGQSPKLTRLNTSEWSRAVRKARAATKKLAFDLVDVYSRRANVEGFSFKINPTDKNALDKTFKFTLTPDQRRAIEDVFEDMQSRKVMDRLICGDVGFGKTEVAIRAAYVCAKNKKQTIVLCPTTILCEQHFETFNLRLKDLGVSVASISRFKTIAQQREILEKFKGGKLDVLVGTHRLLSSDVNPCDLGLVIIDEEQRFGVGHKEKMKNLREVVDVLALSATPIPRTLQMSISGIREMSLILTPPKDRRPVNVFVGAFDIDLVSAAIRKELSRNGQVYFVSNRVNTIDLVEEKISEIAPEAYVGVAHGQMSKTELESVMEAFAAKKIDILIATTIIENGIDNPNTNTLIISDSHNLGLSQMYQLKGRVGRSGLESYAYFFYPPNLPLTEKTSARLMALGEHTELGSGLKIAMRDLEIRGAGEMFGAEQSGNLSDVGFDLFAAMLSREVMRAKEGKLDDEQAKDVNVLSDISINISESALLPDDYIEDIEDRVLIYRKVSFARSENALRKIFLSVEKKYGEVPEVAINFFARAAIRSLAFSLSIKTISIAKGYLEITPINIDEQTSKKLRQIGGIYSLKRQILKVPIRNIMNEGDSYNVATYKFMKSLL